MAIKYSRALKTNKSVASNMDEIFLLKLCSNYLVKKNKRFLNYIYIFKIILNIG